MSDIKNEETPKQVWQHYTHYDLIDMTAFAISQAEKDIAFYTQLQEHISNPFDNELINNIRLDKIKFLKYMEDIYFSVSDNDINRKENIIKEVSDLKLVFKAKMFEELENIEFLRRLYFAFKDNSVKDMIIEVLIDEQIHAQWLAYLYSEYSRQEISV